MEASKTILFLAMTLSSTFSAGSVVEASARPVSDISAAPMSAPAASPVPSPAYAPVPAPEDINLDFNNVDNVTDFIPLLQQIPYFDFSFVDVDSTAKDLCDSTDYGNECIAAILPELRQRGGEGKSGVKPIDVLRMETRSLYEKANATLEYAKRVMEDPSTPERVKKALNACVDNYGSLLGNLKAATKAIDGGDYGRLETVLSATITEVSTCSDAFVEVPEVDSPTAFLDDFLKKLCSNVLAISQLIQYH